MDTLESHPVPDSVDPQDWTLRVTGAVTRPLHLAKDELVAFPDEEFTDDFTCVEGWRAQDLSWRGIRVEALLSQASPTADDAYVLVHAMDDEYVGSFPIERAQDALLAFELDGQPLPVEHGGPARLVPTDPDAGCWESIKWVSKIEVVEKEPVDRDTAKEIALDRISEPSE